MLTWLRRRGNFCPQPLNPSNAPSNQTWIGFRPNHKAVASILSGSWFSTTTAGRCAAGHVPGDASGCSWRPIAIRKALNYTCLQSNVAEAVIKHNTKCFDACPEGPGARDPNPPSDCWTQCFFNTFLGNVTLGFPAMTRAPLIAAWEVRHLT